ncbi:hypothetical protein [Beijerinckia indica]|uniref:Uncharacterized protein n=1 Tax=Beijerinckia indica subsp. indica (strain ATCC 9039 / DSM 1715 / NCIMB 8712) TaxID=395963 RepID=B2IB28_BEII9|nr:hypothetical protein [Beijerinckia indica]ACB93728.1 hypothetical protein Bind_0069 [Beijerinckia indica subsp. indica ATCC 9039]
MIKEYKTSGLAILAGWALVTIMAAFLVTAGWDWYHYGHLRLCLPEDSLGAPYGRYDPPANPQELRTPRYWCAYSTLIAAQRGDRYHDIEHLKRRTPSLLEGIQLDTGKAPPVDLTASPSNNMIGNFFHVVATRIIRLASKVLGSWFNNKFVPVWNSFVADDADPSSAGIRFVLAAGALALFVAMLAMTIKMTWEWAQTVWSAKDASRASSPH